MAALGVWDDVCNYAGPLPYSSSGVLAPNVGELLTLGTSCPIPQRSLGQGGGRLPNKAHGGQTSRPIRAY